MSISISGNGSITGATTSYSFDQSVSIGGTLTYEDVTNIDSVGVVTARSGVYFGSPGSGTQVDGNSTGIGIGTDNPGAKLEVRDGSSQGIIVRSNSTQATDTNKALRVRNNSDANTFHVSHKGQGYFEGSVGIGTDTPRNSAKLDVLNSTSCGAYINYDGRSNTEYGLRIESNAAGGNFESDFSNGTTALLDLFANSSAVTGGDLLVARTQSSTPVLLVKGNGNVGIRTDNPSRNFDVEGNAQIINDGGTAFITGRDRALETYGAIGFADADTVQITAGSGGTRNVAMQFRTANSGTETTRMTLSSDGLITINNSNTLGDGGFRCSVNAASNGIHFVRFNCGANNDRTGLYFENQGVVNARVWVDDSTNLRISGSNPTAHNSGTVVGTQTSDERLKNVGETVAYGLTEVLQLQPKQYALKTEPDTNKLGFIAQEVESIIPEAVFDTGEELEGHQEGDRTKLGMEYVQLIPVLVNAIKEQQVMIETLEQRLSDAGIA